MSWFHFYCSVRTFSSSVEATLTTAALSLWPWTASPSTRRPTVALAALATVVRASRIPTRERERILTHTAVERFFLSSNRPRPIFPGDAMSI